MTFTRIHKQKQAAGRYTVGKCRHSQRREAPHRDIGALKAQCGLSILTSEQCYSLFSKIGIDYGPGQQGIQQIHIGSNQALAELRSPSFLEETADQYVLHPCMLDSALQATIGLKCTQMITSCHCRSPLKNWTFSARARQACGRMSAPGTDEKYSVWTLTYAMRQAGSVSELKGFLPE